MSYQTPVGRLLLHKFYQELSKQFSFFKWFLHFENVGDPDAESEGHFFSRIPTPI